MSLKNPFHCAEKMGLSLKDPLHCAEQTESIRYNLLYKTLALLGVYVIVCLDVCVYVHVRIYMHVCMHVKWKHKHKPEPFVDFLN